MLKIPFYTRCIFDLGRGATARKILAVTFMTFDPLIIGRATMGTRTKVTFTAWREVKNIMGHGDVFKFS